MNDISNIFIGGLSCAAIFVLSIVFYYGIIIYRRQSRTMGCIIIISTCSAVVVEKEAI